ncbi:Efflux pump periplasmic linker BepF [Legionella massiliensis]|uniref:Efflux pump periplasmic linker BepF n=1 Tax=Legionella massiliensis TaxID=1034943 RepID=A0A078KSG5_9GAMM|nr:efflux RND transporter periplasmic adaptor subunit [Legionella massiliensis]CDZ75902.1 Efflux pump periplasmic linker BepF [Legionella massiliensis]CEE11640.1 Efflux pump periplasmic linker BepF [Legionella massiliensis]
MPEDSQRRIKSDIWRRAIQFFCFLFVVFLALVYLRIRAENKLSAETLKEAVPVVASLIVKPGPATEEIILPGNVQAWHEATIYARTNGYIRKWYVDIGSKVKTGDLLADIESPEVDAQLHQAEADLRTAIANEGLAKSTAIRWVGLLKTDSVSKQETDEKVSTAKAMIATVNAAKANRDRLKELVSFEKVIAPFDGVISSRTTDIGSLINAGSGTSDVPLFHIVQSDPIRVYVQIPQTYATRLTPEMEVSLHFTEHPGKTYPAKLYQTANAIDPKSLTLLAQFTAANPKGELLAGGYTEVHFKMPLSDKLVRIPVNTLLFRSEGLQVGVIDSDNKVSLKKITISRDFGNEVEVNTGLVAGERIVLNPPDSLANGEKVRLQKETEQQESAQK